MEKRKLFVVCPYDRWGRYWFKELLAYYVGLNKECKVNSRDRAIEIGASEIIFIPRSKLESMTLGRKGFDVVFWSGSDVEELNKKIRKVLE